MPPTPSPSVYVWRSHFCPANSTGFGFFVIGTSWLTVAASILAKFVFGVDATWSFLLGSNLVYAGFSLGVMSAQMLAQTGPGAKGALLLHGCVPTSEFGGRWPHGVPLQIHIMDANEWGDVEVARDLA